MVMKMPSITPTNATPRKLVTDKPNSTFRRRYISHMPGRSAKDRQAAMTTAPSAALGRLCNRVGANISSSAIMRAPMSPVACVREPAASATGVRDALLLIEKP